jgi:hypothetical protein
MSANNEQLHVNVFCIIIRDEFIAIIIIPLVESFTAIDHLRLNKFCVSLICL